MLKHLGRLRRRGTLLGLLAVVALGVSACQPSTGYAILPNKGGSPTLVVWNFTCPKSTNVLSGNFRLIDATRHLKVTGTINQPDSSCGTGRASYLGDYTNGGGQSSVCPATGSFTLEVDQNIGANPTVSVALSGPINSEGDFLAFVIGHNQCLNLRNRSVDIGFVRGGTPPSV